MVATGGSRLSAAGCEVPIVCFETATVASKPSGFGSASTESWTEQQKLAKRRGAEVIAILGLQSQPQSVDARIHGLPADLLERPGHPYDADQGALGYLTPRRGAPASDRQCLDPPELECRRPDGHLVSVSESSVCNGAATVAGGGEATGVAVSCAIAGLAMRRNAARSPSLNGVLALPGGPL